mmetsp:Transcript_14777/g.36977  ORF Transcript_14777/g.36977 Transcript_14777/m.36977 type:complete len:273 (+) Transcript_14777:358-1176(+)
MGARAHDQHGQWRVPRPRRPRGLALLPRHRRHMGPRPLRHGGHHLQARQRHGRRRREGHVTRQVGRRRGGRLHLHGLLRGGGAGWRRGGAGSMHLLVHADAVSCDVLRVRLLGVGGHQARDPGAGDAVGNRSYSRDRNVYRIHGAAGGHRGGEAAGHLARNRGLCGDVCGRVPDAHVQDHVPHEQRHHGRPRFDRRPQHGLCLEPLPRIQRRGAGARPTHLLSHLSPHRCSISHLFRLQIPPVPPPQAGAHHRRRRCPERQHGNGGFLDGCW